MAEKPRPPQGVQLADLLRRAGVQPPSVVERAPQPAPPERPAPPPPEPAAPPEEVVSEPVVAARIRAPEEAVPSPPAEAAEAPEREGDERVVTIELTLTARQLAQILSERVPEVMTLEHAAAYLHVSPSYLGQLCRENRAPGFKVGRRWRFKKSILDRWLVEAVGERGQLRLEECEAEAEENPEPFADLRSL